METDPREHEAQVDDPSGETAGEQPPAEEEGNGDASEADEEGAGAPEAPTGP